jgi:hypothetical protein
VGCRRAADSCRRQAAGGDGELQRGDAERGGELGRDLQSSQR